MSIFEWFQVVVIVAVPVALAAWLVASRRDRENDAYSADDAWSSIGARSSDSTSGRTFSLAGITFVSSGVGGGGFGGDGFDGGGGGGDGGSC